MSATAAPTRPGVEPTAGPQRADLDGRRFSRWRSNWRLALVMGYRDARRYRGRSVLIMLMIGLPVLIMVGGLSLYFTVDVSEREALPTTLGSTAAKVTDFGNDVAVRQDAEAHNTGPRADGRRALTVPGHVPGQPWTAEQLARVTGGTALPIGYANPRLRVGRTWHNATMLVMSGPDLVRSGLGRLERGRFPERPGELAVTVEAVHRGLPEQGPVTLVHADGTSHPYAVVGVVEATGRSYATLDGLTVDPALDVWERSFLIDRTAPLPWAEVERINDYGLTVVSRAVVEDPPPASAIDPELRSSSRAADGAQAASVALAVVGLVAETTLLAGPAFAVSAARRRRSLALAASNGAERHQLRQYVLAQALVLGGIAAVVGALLGQSAALLVVTVLQWNGRNAHLGPFEVHALPVLGVIALALAASVIAALAPARGSGRLEMTDVLAGRTSAGPVRRSYPIIGLIMVLVGALASVGLMRSYASTAWIGFVVAGTALLTLVGAIFTVPALLSGLVPVLGRLGLVVRLAARDSVRQRSRAVPAVAAIMVATAAITALGVSDRSGQVHDEREYVAVTVPGQGVVVSRGPTDTGGTVAEIRRQFPDWTLVPRSYLGSRIGYEGTTGRQQAIGVVVPGCTAAETIEPVEDLDLDSRCHQVGNDSVVGEIAVADPSIAELAGVSTEQRRVLAAGGVLVAEPSLVVDGRVTIAVGAYDAAQPEQITLNRTVKVPAAAAGPGQLTSALPGAGTQWGGWTLPATAQRLDLGTALERTEVIAPGPISAVDEEAVNAQVDPDAAMYVERGYQPPSNLTILIMFGVAGLLVLVAALIATALGQAESRGDLATLAALGSTVGLRRRLAAAQAVLVALLGTVLGIVVGLPTGVASAIMTTGVHDTDDGRSELVASTIALPWTGFAILLTAVPLLAMGVAALGVRRMPTMTRRID